MTDNTGTMEADKHSRIREGCVFNIQRYTVHDGPGIRTEIFLKGCPLRCRWCSNPESMSMQPEAGVFSSRCIGISRCGYCIKACPLPGKGAIITGGDTVTGIDRSICSGCLKCADACPSDAVTVWGRKTGIEDVMKVISTQNRGAESHCPAVNRLFSRNSHPDC